MEDQMTLSGNEIKNLITKFYYKNNHLCFQILLSMDKGNMLQYNEYADYNEYKLAFNELMSLKTGNSTIELKQLNYETSDINLV